MFYGCSSLTQAPALPATTLAEGCYASMFKNCSSLTQAPALPATTLAECCYEYMFESCTSLTQAPALPATTLANSCYASMFESCTSLTQAPTIKTYTPNLQAFENMLHTFNNSEATWGKLTSCNWPDLTLSEAESMILNDTVFGYDDGYSGVMINITCKDGNGVAHYSQEDWSWFFDY